MDQKILFDLADNLAEYIRDYAKAHGIEVCVETCCCGTLQLRYLDPESNVYLGADVDVEPLEGDVE